MKTMKNMKQSRFILFVLSFLVMSVGNVYAQNVTVTGTVLDSTGEPVIGANVKVAGKSSIGTITDFEGNFSLSVPADTKKLEISYIGMLSQEAVIKPGTPVKVILKEDTEELDEVVVIGYGTVKKRDLTGSMTSIKQADIIAVPTTNALESLQGKVAGLDMTKSSGQTGSGLSFSIRGNRSLNASNAPLIIVDGVPYGTDIDINPNVIESMEILKDASSTAIYGSRGANGVVIISTKKGSEGRSFVEYSGTVSFGSVMNLPDFCNADEYMQYRMERDRGEHADDLNYKPDMLNVVGEQQYNNYQAGKFVDWADLAFKTSVSTSHSVRAYGSSRGMNYTFGAGYTSEKGVLGVDGYTRYNVSAAIDKEINKYLKVGSNIYTTYGLTDYSSNELFRSIFRLNPLTDVYNEDGSLRLFPDATTSNISNPLVEADPNNNSKKHKYLHVFGNLFVEIKPISWLKFRACLKMIEIFF